MQQGFGTDNHYIQDEGRGHRYYLCPLAYKFWWEHCFKHSNVIEIHDAITYLGLPHMLCYGGILTPLAPGSTYTLSHISSPVDVQLYWCWWWSTAQSPSAAGWVLHLLAGEALIQPGWPQREGHYHHWQCWPHPGMAKQWPQLISALSFFQLLLPSVCKVFPKAHLTAIIYLFD